MSMFEVKNLSISFGGLRAVDSFDLTIEKNELYGLIGPNGAGKTTVFNLLTGVYKPGTGVITLDGKNITGKSTIDINKAGIARTFQNIRLFKDLTVKDNVKAGLYNQYKYSMATGMFRLPGYYKKEKAMNKKALELLKVFDLDSEAETIAANLPYGKQRKLEIARALATNPKLLLLDEPVTGLDPKVTIEFYQLIKALNEEGITIIMITHDIHAAVEYAGKILHLGQNNVFFGTKEEYKLSDAYKEFEV